MPGHRKAAEDFILEYIQKIDPSGENVKIYQHKFQAMNDDDFEKMIEGLENNSVYLAIVSPNMSNVKLDVERNFKIAEELNHEFFQRIRMPARDGLPAYLTPIKYLVIDLPVRRQAQLLEKKISIPEDNNSVDDFTGQPTGKSKGSRVSYPEIQVLAAQGLENCLIEFLKYRGGDEKGFNAMNTMISRTGGVSQKAIEPFASGVKSTMLLRNYLQAMHLRNTLV
jgi:hypothetical protein